MEVKKGYKKTEVGIIPEDWEVEPIKKIATITTGSKNTQDKVDDGLYPFFVRSQVVERINSYSFDGEAVLTAGDGVGTGKVFHYINGKFDLHQRVYKISNFVDEVNGYYFYLFFSNNFLKRIVSMTAKSSVDSVRLEMIADMFVPIPSKQEQAAIAQVLSDTDELISSLEKLIEKKKQIKQGVMQQLLTGKKRLPGFSGKWEVKKLGEIAEIKDGTHQTPNYVEDGIPFYSVENITDNNFSHTKFITLEEHNKLTKTYKIEKGDILMTRIGSIGDCKLIDWDVEASFYVSLALLKIKKGYYNKFIYHLIKSYNFQKEIELKSLPWAVPKKINLGAISSIEIKLPSDIIEQEKIAEIIGNIASEIESLEQKLNKYKLIKQGMMENLLTGKIRLV
jgi:type I restriction enzyme S subunit